MTRISSRITSLLILFLCDKNFCTVLNTAFEIFSVVTKHRCHFHHHTSRKTQKYLYGGKNIKKNFLQLRCSNVFLHVKYKVLLRESKIKFKKTTEGKALATDHRGVFDQSERTQHPIYIIKQSHVTTLRSSPCLRPPWFSIEFWLACFEHAD